jgi:hypothetical protein
MNTVKFVFLFLCLSIIFHVSDVHAAYTHEGIEEIVRDTTKKPVSQKKLQRRYQRLVVRSQFKNAIDLQLTALALGNFQLTYMRYLSSQWGIGFDVGYKPAYQHGGTYENKLVQDAYTEIMLMPFAASQYASLNVKKYIDTKTFLNMYLMGSFFYRSSSFDNGKVTWKDSVDGRPYAYIYHDSLSVKQKQFGLKIIYGLNPIFKLSEKYALELDVYAGLSFRNSNSTMMHYEQYFVPNAKYVPQVKTTVILNEEDQSASSYFFPVLGIKAGLRF